MTKADILRQLSIGSRVAEDEIEQLSRYFVETDQWRRILADEVDVVFGPKGAGKSAMYTSLVSRAENLFDRQILLVPDENPRGTPAFAEIVADPPTSEPEFVALWKFYLLGLLDQAFEDWSIKGDEVRRSQHGVADPKMNQLVALITVCQPSAPSSASSSSGSYITFTTRYSELRMMA